LKKDRLFSSKEPRSSDFEFNDTVATVFDDMLVRSVPFYTEQQLMIAEITKKFLTSGTDVYDLGCSTATTLINLARQIDSPTRLIGYDNSRPMLEKARRKIKQAGFEERIELRFGDLNGSLDNLTLDNAGVVTMCWTMQFIRPLQRERLIKWINASLVENGVFVVTEKVLTNSTNMNRFFIDFYYDFKRKNGYSEMEISRKREALENVLIPYRIDENIEMFRRNHFEIVETFFQWYNFVGFMCFKTMVHPEETSKRLYKVSEIS
jgi:tRNA (cmo5U34)-methyltransferase